MEHICVICGKPIPDTRTSGNTKYCSPKCARQAQMTDSVYYRIRERAKRKGKYNRDILPAYGYKCAICGWSLSGLNCGGQHGLEIHHIIPVSEGGTDETKNLIPLCPNHHSEAHHQILSRNFLQSLTMSEDEMRLKAEQNNWEIICNASDIIDNLYD